ncbi:Bug family tripartite tricarboxylate transporter substrate binding protein [Acidovorax sp.]|uniref:Bug family tripartite tricarboxylate transporter substrate binding protein n=1 Tax=Acidovorax sp. TaxID=1872122 RepID=UPI003919A789
MPVPSFARAFNFSLGNPFSLHLGAALLGVAALAAPATVGAQAAYPNKPIRLIVPFPPGGGTDMIVRTVAQKLADQNQWSVVVDNRPGAGGNLGVDAASKSPADGYTLVMGQTSNLAINPSLYAKLPYDPLKDLAPVALVSSSPIVMAVRTASPYKTFADVVAAAKGKPDHITLGYSGNGTVAHLAGELAQNAAGIKLRHIPYKGASQAMTDLVGGQIDLYMSSVPTLLGQVRNGKLRVLAITSAQRSSQLPDTPTLAESGYKGFEAVTWFGILAPTGTPAPIVAQLNKAINEALKHPEVAEKLRSEGGDVLGGTAEQFSALLKAEVPRWAKIVKDSGASLD